jgi:hypothetical protein
MKKSFLAGALAVLMLAAVLAAGCTTNPTSSPTPTSSIGTATSTSFATAQNVSQYLTLMMQQRNFTVVRAFSLQPSTQAGIAVYNGTVSDQNGTYVVSVQACNNTQTAQAQFLSQRTMFMGQGYAAMQQNETAWSGFNASARQGAAVEYGTSGLIPFYCMVITGGATGQAPFQQTMWQHMWDVMHTYGGNDVGVGPYMGQGLNTTLRTQMQEEMQEHMGSGFGPGMTSSS